VETPGGRGAASTLTGVRPRQDPREEKVRRSRLSGACGGGASCQDPAEEGRAVEMPGLCVRCRGVPRGAGRGAVGSPRPELGSAPRSRGLCLCATRIRFLGPLSLQSGRGPPPRCSCSPGLGPAGSFPRPRGQDPGGAPAPSRRLASLLLREVLTRSFGRVTDSAVSLSPQHRHSVSALRPPAVVRSPQSPRHTGASVRLTPNRDTVPRTQHITRGAEIVPVSTL